ncbi:CU044_2847 family protein [Streptomyces bungoensis]|uniref:CU044_2847 family protein n=1 Tax=Streptomyces bungoensis TaxID=285568 RepID=UPI0034326E60
MNGANAATGPSGAGTAGGADGANAAHGVAGAAGTSRVARVQLPDGTPVWARISGAEELAVPTGGLSYTDTGFAERVEASVESLHSLITGVARSLAAPLRAVRPDEVSVEFGIELTAKAGKVVGLLADGEAKAGITVTLTWNDGGPPDPDAPRTTAAAPPTPTQPPPVVTGPPSAGAPGQPPAIPPAPASPPPPGAPRTPAAPHSGASTGGRMHGGFGVGGCGGGA